MGLFYEREVTPESGGIRIVELIAMSPVEGVPPRPEPGPTPPDVRPEHPIFYPPEVAPPIYFPGLPPGHYPPGWGQPGNPTPPLPGVPAGRLAYVSAPPAGATPPAELAADASWMLVVMERGSPPTWAKINPYASTGPITPPA